MEQQEKEQAEDETSGIMVKGDVASRLGDSRLSSRSSGSDDWQNLEDSVRSCMHDFRQAGQQAAIDRAFTTLDIKKNGQLDRSEIAAFMEQAAKLIRLQVADSVIGDAVDALLEDVGADTDHVVSKAQFHDLFVRHPDLLRCFDDENSVASRHEMAASRTLSRKELVDADQENEQVWLHAHTHWKNKRLFALWTFLYISANVAAFTYKAVTYARRDAATEVFGNCIAVARGSAQCLNLNACLILLPICRHFFTRLRATHLRFIFPFDAVLDYHMFIGLVMAGLVVVHVSAHVCDFHRFAHAEESAIRVLFGSKLGDDIPESVSDRWKLLLRQPAAITGILMVACMVLAFPFILYRRTNFNAFWVTHHFLLVLLVALCFHGSGSLLEPFQSVYWLMGPLALYLIPRLWRESPMSQTKVLDISVKEGNIVGLKLARPPAWDGYVKAGMYAFINVPKVSCLEWHPFTLTSAPCDDFIEFHFARAGDWTGHVHDLLEDLCADPLTEEEGQSNSNQAVSTAIPKDLVVKVEGPVGASSQGFSDHPIVVLIGAGIGVTPMISVLKQLLVTPGKMKRVFLYWTVRDRAAFAWFTRLMDDIFEADAKNIIQIRHFLTSVKDDDRDIGAVLLHHATRAKHHKTNFDMLLGNYTHHQVEVGRPDWEEELTSVKIEAKELECRDCGIFLCGPEKMAEAVAKVSFAMSKEDPGFHFYFNKETF
jgi:respiratory burst oxidase